MWPFNRNHDSELQPPSISELHEQCKLLARAERGDTRQFACLFSGMNLRYYADVLSQARNSFLFALAASATGVAFFIFAAWQMYEHDRRGWIGLIAGGLLQVISGTEFYLYGKASALARLTRPYLRTRRKLVSSSTVASSVKRQVSRYPPFAVEKVDNEYSRRKSWLSFASRPKSRAFFHVPSKQFSFDRRKITSRLWYFARTACNSAIFGSLPRISRCVMRTANRANDFPFFERNCYWSYFTLRSTHRWLVVLS
jgi:hypothetical protein